METSENIGFLLHRLAFSLDRLSDQVLQEQLGIGYSQFKILMTLDWKPNIQQKEIATELGQTEASISRQIVLLVSKNLITSVINPRNRREHVVQLSPKGLRTIQTAFEILNDYHAPMFKLLNEKQIAQFAQTMNIMKDYLGNSN